MTNKNEVLKTLGLSSKESLVYIACLQLGSVSASDVAKQTSIQRTHVYDLAEKLIEKGFLRQTRQTAKRLFSAVPPREILEAQSLKLERARQNIPELEAITNINSAKPRIFYYEGEGGLEMVSKEAAMTGGESLVFSSEDFYIKESGVHQKINIEKRLEGKTKCRTIAGMSSSSLKSQRKDKEELRETRLLPTEIFDPKVLLGMYKNRTYVMNYKRNFGFIIEDSDFTDTLEMLFEIVWDSGKIVKK